MFAFEMLKSTNPYLGKTWLRDMIKLQKQRTTLEDEHEDDDDFEAYFEERTKIVFKQFEKRTIIPPDALLAFTLPIYQRRVEELLTLENRVLWYEKEIRAGRKTMWSGMYKHYKDEREILRGQIFGEVCIVLKYLCGILDHGG